MRPPVACDGQVSDNPKHKPPLASDSYQALLCKRE